MRLLYLAAPERAAYLARAFGQAGHVVDAAADLADLLLLAGAGGRYDAVLLEAAAPADIPLDHVVGLAGLGVVAILVDKAGPAERVRMLREGADACFTRPVSFMELEARLTALARLAQRGRGEASALALDPATRTARMSGRSLMLPMHQFALLEHLAARPGQVIPAQQIHEQVWGEAGDSAEGRVRTAVARLRARLAAAFGLPLIETVRGHGYRFAADPAAKMKLSSSG